MHLLNVDTLQLETFYDSEIPKYAILSHTWGKDEVTFADIQNPTFLNSTSLAGFEKIRMTCQQASADGYQYAWVDTCCIDKSSSAELSEAINSMFKWYQDSQACYAYLSDVSQVNFETTFPRSRWFSRGWTLQELLAPRLVTFYDQDWYSVGTRDSQADLISGMTGIDVKALRTVKVHRGSSTCNDLQQFCVAKRMSWASRRQTTRVEDMAYSLLGIFNVHMPLLYGEGQRAFVRLQEEIIKTSNDDSILAWGLDTNTRDDLDIVESPFVGKILATSPRDFKNCQHLEYALGSQTPFTMTNIGLQIELPLVPIYPSGSQSRQYSRTKNLGWIGLLSCSTGVPTEFLAIHLWADSPVGQRPTNVRRTMDNKSTLVVGPLIAAKAARTQVTINHEYVKTTGLDKNAGFRLFIINLSEALLDHGYVIKHASVLGGIALYTGGNPIKWEMMTNVFTVLGKDIVWDLIQFEFTSLPWHPDSEFSIFIRGGSAIVRKGSSFSRSEEASFFTLLEDQSCRESEPAIVVRNNKRSSNRILVSMKMNDVLSRRIFEVDVDVDADVDVDVNAGPMDVV
jgi:hypothetical protein